MLLQSGGTAGGVKQRTDGVAVAATGSSIGSAWLEEVHRPARRYRAALSSVVLSSETLSHAHRLRPGTGQAYFYIK